MGAARDIEGLPLRDASTAPVAGKLESSTSGRFTMMLSGVRQADQSGAVEERRKAFANSHHRERLRVERRSAANSSIVCSGPHVWDRDRRVPRSRLLFLDEFAQPQQRPVPLRRDLLEIAADLTEPLRLQLPDALASGPIAAHQSGAFKAGSRQSATMLLRFGDETSRGFERARRNRGTGIHLGRF
jgi:hypothetical protein